MSFLVLSLCFFITVRISLYHPIYFTTFRISFKFETSFIFDSGVVLQRRFQNPVKYQARKFLRK